MGSNLLVQTQTRANLEESELIGCLWRADDHCTNAPQVVIFEVYRKS